jgi:phosphoribosylanthranilate isomerase
MQAVGVFVDEDAEAIASACATARLDAAQLHGDGARAAFAALPTDLPVLYVLHANAAGELQTPLPDPAGQRCGPVSYHWYTHAQQDRGRAVDLTALTGGGAVWLASHVSRARSTINAVRLRQRCR